MLAIARLLLVSALIAMVPGCTGPVDDATSSPASARKFPPAEPRTDHPRLFVRSEDVPRLRSWATPGNPVYAKGLAVKVAQAEQLVADGTVPGSDSGLWSSYEQYPTETFAELFAFMSLVHPDQAKRDHYGKLARRLLMYIIDKAAPGVGGDEDPWRAFGFSTFNRSRWAGEAFGLTVDWAYRYFSAEDKAKIRTVFLRWAGEQFRAYPATAASGGAPDFRPAGPFNAASLAADRAQARWATNNYFSGHMRNLVLMAAALDERDDPGGELRGYLRNATGQWLYLTDLALRTDAAGGLSPEGSEYAASSLAYVAQTLHALHSAGLDDPARWGDQVTYPDKKFWPDFITALYASLPNQAVPPEPELTEDQGEGRTFQPATFGDLERYWAPDLIDTLAPLALLARELGDTATQDAARWYELNVPYGGEESLYERAGAATDQQLAPILYFLLFDPEAEPPADPRPALPLVHDVTGQHVTLARTCWCDDARQFTYSLTWRTIDHQGADANAVEFGRKGEWLTKKRTGYDLSIMSDFQNTMAVENDPVDPGEDPRWVELGRRGSQAFQVQGDPVPTAASAGKGYLYRAGDATKTYNSAVLGTRDVKEASRAVMWLQPDHIVIFDRAETGKGGRFKRFWLQTPSLASISGATATARTRGGQRLFVTTLLPDDAAMTSEPAPAEVGGGYDAGPATGEPMKFRLRIDAPGDPRRTRFLTVLQGADGGARPDASAVVHSSDGTPYTGALVAGTLVLFPDASGGTVATTTVVLPAGTNRVLVTGLRPDAGYAVTRAGGRLTVRAGGPAKTDAGGVLDVKE